MAVVDLVTLFPDVLPEVPACPEPTALNALRMAATRLCRFAPVWQHEPAAFAVAADQAEYDLAVVGDLPSYGKAVRVMSPILVNGGDRRIYPTLRDRLNSTVAGWEKRTGSTVETYFMHGQNVLRVTPIPDSTCTDQLSLRLWMRPSDDAQQIDDVLLEYRDAIADGAKFRLMSMPGQPWTQPQMAVVYGRQFNNAMRVAYAATSKDYTDASLSVQMRPWR